MGERLVDIFAEFDVPPTMLEPISEMVDMIADELGESPEAWRGAAMYARSQAQVLNIARQDATVDQMLTLVALLSAMFVDRWMTLAAAHG